MKASELYERIQAKTAPVLIDPRSEKEFRGGHIPGAVNMPVRKLMFSKVKLPKNKNAEIVSACMHGQRAWIAKQLLCIRGYRNVVFLEGWIQGWMKDGLPVEK